MSGDIPLDAPDFPRQSFCPITGRVERMEGHHAIKRSQGGTDGPVVYIGDTAHDLIHDKGLLKLDHTKSGWYWCIPRGHDDDTQRAALRLAASWKRAQKRNVEPGVWYPFAREREGIDTPPPEVVSDAPEPDGDLLDECRSAILDAVSIEGTVAWAQGSALLRVFDHLHATLSAGDAAREYRAFYEPLGFSSALASKRVLIARHVPADAGIGPAKAYEVALGVKEEAWTLDAGLALAREASCSDLKARRTGGEPEARPERHLMCPACKTTHAASEYLTVKEGA
jgi:hypothetical protein